MKRKCEKDLTGRKFHKWTVLGLDMAKYIGPSRVRWLCECVCGEKRNVRQDMLLSNESKSCGHDRTRTTKAWEDPRWVGCGELSGQHFGEIRCRAKREEHEFNVTIEYVWELFEKQGRKCAITGEPLVFHSLKEKRMGLAQTASLDRIDSFIGYLPGNVHWVHKDVNRMKNSFTMDRFFEICVLATNIHNLNLPAWTEEDMCHNGI